MSKFAPEPQVTPEELVNRAKAMRTELRERQVLCEEKGQIPEETNDAFIKAGFYRILQPRRFGGYEFDLPTFIRVMIEIARGCVESGWVLALTAGHAAIMARFSEAGQIDAFADNGEFRAPGVAMPGGAAVPVTGGYRIKGAWDYASGCDVATHFLGASLITKPDSPAPAGMMWALFDRSDYTITNNWNVLGMQGTGSKRVVIEERFVPEHRVLHFSNADFQVIRKHPGHAVHANPLYHGPVVPTLISEVAAVSVGAAMGALDVYEQILRTKRTNFPPFNLRSDEQEFQRHYGTVVGLIATAEAALLQMGADYMQLGGDGTDEQERKLMLIEQHCVRLAWEAIELMFRTAGSSAATKTSMLGRYFRNMAVIRTHLTLQIDHSAGNLARSHFGLPPLSSL
jgi:3-hydroxy-9,10-secoandrosta-1,3,5(10)-triene-9,17-dione monooxygenase